MNEQRQRAERALFIAYGELARARAVYDRSEASRTRLRRAIAALEAAEIIALALTLAASHPEQS